MTRPSSSSLSLSSAVQVGHLHDQWWRRVLSAVRCVASTTAEGVFAFLTLGQRRGERREGEGPVWVKAVGEGGPGAPVRVGGGGCLGAPRAKKWKKP